VPVSILTNFSRGSLPHLQVSFPGAAGIRAMLRSYHMPARLLHFRAPFLALEEDYCAISKDHKVRIIWG
jgi:hypothetical protein